ncbi:hypothetical protein [Candidatus Endomicrobiellum agilis]|uniref:hypothetical protein n=1 Tax=Candidatus Endomicrobiellum agilis TaxID=3238957 RepID=UPI003576D8FF|nr:hypothetical protein [Endomicrobium sp.]
MKKTICICICICLMSGCGKSLRHGRPVNAVAEDKGSEGVSTHSPLTSDTSNASASTPEAQPASDTADTGSSVWKYVGYTVAFAFVCYGGYKLLYRFASFTSIDSRNKLSVVKDIPEGYRKCYFYGYHSFDNETNECIDEIPIVKEGSYFICWYLPNPSKLKPLKTWLRKILGIKTPVVHL